MTRTRLAALIDRPDRDAAGATRAHPGRLPLLAGLVGLSILVLAAGGARPGSPAAEGTPAGRMAPADSTLLATTTRDTSSLAPTPGVRDPVFSVLLGFMLDHHTGGLDGDRIAAAVKATGRPTSIPFEMIRLLARRPPDDSGAGGRPAGARVDLLLDRDLNLPVPYKILVYHPGSFQGTRHTVLRDLDLGRQIIPCSVKEGEKETSRPFMIDKVRFCILEEGRLLIDVDGWVDALAGDKIDDTSTAALVIYRKDGLWYGLALGYNRDGEPRSGTLSFAEDKVLFPGPPEIRAVSRQMRKLLETYVPSIRERFKGW